MKFKEFLKASNLIEKIIHNININDFLLELSYSIIFDKISVRIEYKNETYYWDLKVNLEDELILDLTNDRKLIEDIGPEIYSKIINIIFNEEL